MVFDPIMNVGNIPQVTQDIAVSPLTLSDDISSLIFAQFTLGSGCTSSGTFLGILNNFDLTNIFFGITNPTAGSRTSTVLLDLGKTLQLRGVSLYFSLEGATGQTVTLAYSSDNVNYTTYDTATNGSIPLYFNSTGAGFRARYLRFTIVQTPSGTINFRNCKVQLDSVQRFY